MLAEDRELMWETAESAAPAERETAADRGASILCEKAAGAEGTANGSFTDADADEGPVRDMLGRPGRARADAGTETGRGAGPRPCARDGVAEVIPVSELIM